MYVAIGEGSEVKDGECGNCLRSEVREEEVGDDSAWNGAGATELRILGYGIE